MALVISIFLLVLSNLLFILYLIIKGKDRLKVAVKEALDARIMEEEKEAEEKRERLEKKRKEEEEFSRMHDDTANNIS